MAGTEKTPQVMKMPIDTVSKGIVPKEMGSETNREEKWQLVAPALAKSADHGKMWNVRERTGWALRE